MSEMIVTTHNFSAPLPAEIDPMGEQVWRSLQPASDEARAIRSAIDRVGDEQTKASTRIEWLLQERERALLRGTGNSVSSIDARLSRARVWTERVNALAAALPRELAAAEEREAEATRVLADRKAAARAGIERFRRWVTVDYPKHAAAIAAGVAMEQDVIAAAAIAGISNEVPRCYTTAESHPRGMPPTTFGHIVRLPNHTPGAPLAWPPGEMHPDLRAPTPLYRQD